MINRMRGNDYAYLVVGVRQVDGNHVAGVVCLSGSGELLVEKIVVAQEGADVSDHLVELARRCVQEKARNNLELLLVRNVVLVTHCVQSSGDN